MGLMDRLRRARRTAEEDEAKEKLRKWRNDMRKEMRQMDREIRKIEMQQKPVIKSIKAATKRGDKSLPAVVLVHNVDHVSLLCCGVT